MMYNPLKAKDQITIAFGLITLLFFSIVLGFSLSVRENTQRIQDIQESRIASCKQTYTALRDVFNGYVIPNVQLNDRGLTAIEKFNDQVNSLRDGCTN